jgi:hypothetical protein
VTQAFLPVRFFFLRKCAGKNANIAKSAVNSEYRLVDRIQLLGQSVAQLRRGGNAVLP